MTEVVTPLLETEKAEEFTTNNLLGVLFRNEAKLTERERTVIVHRFGLYGTGKKTLTEVGKKIGLCREAARYIRDDAIAKLRERALAVAA